MWRWEISTGKTEDSNPSNKSSCNPILVCTFWVCTYSCKNSAGLSFSRIPAAKCSELIDAENVLVCSNLLEKIAYSEALRWGTLIITDNQFED